MNGTLLHAQLQNTNGLTKSYIDSFLKYEFDDTVKAFGFIQKLMVESKKSTRPYNIAKAYLNKGWYYQDRMNYDESMKAFMKSIEYCKKAKDVRCELDLVVNLSNVYIDVADYEQAQILLNNALLKADKIILNTRSAEIRNDLNSGKLGLCANLGVLNEKVGNHEKAIYYYKKVIDLSLQYGDSSQLRASYNNIAIEYRLTNRLDTALFYAKKSAELCLKEKNYFDYANACIQLSKIYDEYKMRDSAYALVDRSLLYCKKYPLGDILITALNQKITLLTNDGRYNEALPLALENMVKCDKYNIGQSRLYCSKLLYRIYKGLGKYRESLRYYEKYTGIRDTLTTAEDKRIFLTKSLQADYASKKMSDSLNQMNENRILKLNHENEIANKQKYIYFFSFGVCVLIVVLVLIYRNFRIKKASNIQLLTLNQAILQQKKEVEMQKEIVEEKQKEIIDSINYAKRIQKAQLPTEKYFERILNKLKNK